MRRIEILLYVGLFCIAMMTASCNSKLQEVMILAGDNKQELKAVIRHYRKDKLKKRAAVFLISNMADKGEIRYTEGGQKEIRPDVKFISADYLIENIDIAFEVWKYPWCSSLSFEEFCEEILPYRMRNEPLESWRKYYYEKYKSMADSLAVNYSSMRETAIFFNNAFRKYYRPEMESIKGELSYKEMEYHKGGSCIQMVLNAVQEMRSFGFPLNIDVIPYHGKLNKSHAYNSFIDEDGKCVGFSPYSPNLTGNGMTAHVVNRIYYESPRYRKVTEQYYNVANIVIDEGNISLATYNDGAFKKVLSPERTDSDRSEFDRITCGLLYFPVRSNMLPARTSPFILEEGGNLRYFEAIEKDETVLLNDVGLYWYRTRVNIEDGYYRLMGWDNGWVEIGYTYKDNDMFLNFGEVPNYGLFLVIGEGEKGQKQRPFILDGGKPNYY